MSAETSGTCGGYSRSECLAPLAPFLGGVGLGVRGERSLGAGSARPFGDEAVAKNGPFGIAPHPRPLSPRKRGRGGQTRGFAAFRKLRPTAHQSPEISETVNGDDEALARLCLKGDELSQRAFVARFQGLVLSICWKMLGHRQDAEDVAQEVFVRAFRHLEHWDQERPLKPWLVTIAVNRCRTALERRSKLPSQNELAIELAVERREHSRLRQEELALGDELQLALAELREDYRSVFVLFHQQELSYQEIGEMLGCPEGTVKTWLHRARAQLATRLRERGLFCETQS